MFRMPSEASNSSRPSWPVWTIRCCGASFNRAWRRGSLGSRPSRGRTRQEEIAARLRSSEEARLAGEQKLQPLRDRIAETRLKEQAARITSEQFAQQLREAGADEAALAAALKEGQKAA